MSDKLHAAYEKYKKACEEFDNEMTLYKGVKVEKDQNGNTSQYENGQQDYPKKDFDNLSKEQIFKQKLMTMKG